MDEEETTPTEEPDVLVQLVAEAVWVNSRLLQLLQRRVNDIIAVRNLKHIKLFNTREPTTVNSDSLIHD